MDGLLISFYPPNLDDQDLAVAVAWIRQMYDHAPRLCGWLLDNLLDEQARRLLPGEVPRETNVMVMPHQRWSGRDLREAATLITVLTYSVRNVMAGKLFDSLALPIQAAVNARLEQLEVNHASH